MWVNPFQMKDWIQIPVILHMMLSTDQNKLIDSYVCEITGIIE